MKATNRIQTQWAEQIPDEQWSTYSQVLRAAQHEGIPFALGGAFALAVYTGRWRNTKDLDLYLLPEDRERMIKLLTRLGLEDLHDRLPYDRAWIYRAISGDSIVDIIWAMANLRAEVDTRWVSQGPTIDLRGIPCRVLPVEETIWTKLFVLQRDRCDWPDVLNLLYASGPEMDWKHMLCRLDGDTALMRGNMAVFEWLCPGRSRMLPKWLWQTLRLPEPEPATGEDTDQEHVRLLDSRPWFRAA